MMKKSHVCRFVFGIAALGSGTAFADPGNVNVYGTLNVDFESVKATDAINPNNDYVNRFRLSSNASNFGIRGIEEIDGPFRAVYQLEVGVNLANGALTNTVSGSVIALRNSMVGLAGNFGTVSYGIWDTPFKVITNQIDPYWGTGVGYMASLANSIGQGATSSTMATEGTTSGTNTGELASFDRRQGNNVQYWSPAIYKTTLRLMYSADADRNATATATARNPDLLSGSLTYDDDSIFGGVSFEQHDDYFDGIAAPITGVSGTHTQDRGVKIAARYKFPFGLSFGGYWDHLKYVQTTTAGDSSYGRGSITFVATQPIDKFTLRLGYAHAADGTCSLASGAVCDVTGYGATHTSIGTSYNLSKRTDVYVLFSKIWNGNNNYNFLVNGVDAVLPAGADPQAIGLGLRHSF